MSTKQFRERLEEDGHRIDGKWNDPDMHYEGLSENRKYWICECGRKSKA